MLSNALTLAAFTSAGFFIIYNKLPLRIKMLMIRYDLITDFLALMLTYIVFGGTVTALIAAALVSIIISILLHIAKYPNDYIWLSDTLTNVSQLIQEGKNVMKNLNQKYVGIKDNTQKV
jgi:hypothetical protein